VNYYVEMKCTAHNCSAVQRAEARRNLGGELTVLADGQGNPFTKWATYNGSDLCHEHAAAVEALLWPKVEPVVTGTFRGPHR
jgi:hypothetical protein